MVQSTVGESILGALTSLGGITGRRAQDGLTAAQAESAALDNQVKKRVLEDDELGRQFGELRLGGYIKENTETGGFDVDAVKLATENADLAKKVIGGDFSKFFKTRNADGTVSNLEFVGIKKVPPQMMAPPAAASAANPLATATGPISLLNPPLQEAAAPAAEQPAEPDRYMLLVRNKEGKVVPATQNASSDPNDPLITLSADEINAQFKGRINRMQASGAAGNVGVQSAMGVSLQQLTTAGLQQAAIDGADNVTDDPVAQRGLYGVMENLQGEDLRNFVRDAGQDPDKIEKELAEKWAADHKSVTEKVPANPKDSFMFQDSKDRLTAQVASAKKALEDYDKTPKGSANKIDNAMNAMGAAESGRIGSPKKTPAPKADPVRAKLVAAQTAAESRLAGLKPPTQKFIIKDVPAPKFEMTDENLRASVAGKLDQPTPEQTAALAKYAREQGVTKAQDLRNLPREQAQALAWIISANSNGSPTEKLAVWEKLSNYAQTGDPTRSAIEANIDIATAQSGQANAAANVAAVGASRDNAALDYAAKIRGQNIDMLKLNYQQNKDVGEAANKVAPLFQTIYDDVLAPDGSFKPEGPTSKTTGAFKEIDSYMMLPDGSPLKTAVSGRYLEALMTTAAANAMKPGAVAFWDLQKAFENTFFREKGRVDMSPLVEGFKVTKWKDGLPEEVTFGEGGARQGMATEGPTVGWKEFTRFLGTSKSKEVMDAFYLQKAANALGNGADPAAVYAKSEELKSADGYVKP